MDDAYTRLLESLVKDLLAPISDIPFYVAIRVVSGCEVYPFRSASSKYLEVMADSQTGVSSSAGKASRGLLDLLKQACAIAVKRARHEGIVSARPNEAGNKVEPYVISALQQVGLSANKPRAKSGKRRAMGYPDIAVELADDFALYMDCKTYSRKTKSQGMRAFYFSPSKDPKVTKPGSHVVVSFEMDRQQDGVVSVFRPTAWAIYDLYDLKLNLKREFNAENPDLYREEALLASGSV